MSDNKAQLLRIVQRYLAGKATATEIKFLESYYDFFKHEENVLDNLISEERKLLGEKMQVNIMAGIEMPPKTDNIRPLWSVFIKVCTAAAILIVGITGFYIAFHKKAQQQTAYQHDILPGSNKAVLTLANGQKIDLNDAKSGVLAKQAGISITKSENGQLIYAINNHISLNKNDVQTAMLTNKIETPNGGQYQVILPDGTHVWLNAASSLTYPTSFSETERKVSLKGEGYFEVAKNPKKPFKVEVNDQTEVKVLGTHFNINAYNEEKTINTTLLEGSVLLKSNYQSAKLIPGQQGQVSKSNDQIALVNNANINQIIAWKNGLFSYDTASLDMIMKQVERWYDVRVVYEDDVKAEFVAKLPRNLPLSELLKLLELTKQVHFKLEGKTLEVMK
jgi:hypothetical protein